MRSLVDMIVGAVEYCLVDEHHIQIEFKGGIEEDIDLLDLWLKPEHVAARLGRAYLLSTGKFVDIGVRDAREVVAQLIRRYFVEPRKEKLEELFNEILGQEGEEDRRDGQ